MPSTTLKRRWTEEGMRGKVPKQRKKVKKQRTYHSSSEDDSEDENVARDAPAKDSAKAFVPVDLGSSDDEEQRPAKPLPKFKATIATKDIPQQAPAEEEVGEDDSEQEEDEDQAEDRVEESDSDASELSDGSEFSETSTNNPRKVNKRNDPEAFATSISRILGTKLTTQKRSEPILSRSKSAQDTNKSLLDHKLTQKAHRQVLADKKAAQEKGHIKDVLGLNNSEISTAATTVKEKQLRRTAQKGVIKLFNAVRAAQVKGEMAEKEARQKGVVGMSKREENVKEMSKQGFLEQITNSGIKKKEGSIDL
ncbi:Rrp15p-domain-containing protein [Melanomma pulvis-pyrius CBS 109.77]|uniref:Rrp15p-domain-containing protein n=1 Tax=Melanomma pulvis-pyrius CBS 109.77 TaxID=1314802 RepID=A0A6A6XBA2_9PLEO|nr:Rrp15p-domain-containing protein [Melanomma pulvis-pyrius CBS 109.77]